MTVQATTSVRSRNTNGFSRRLESDALFESLLGGGPRSSLAPPEATPEPDVDASKSRLRPAEAPAGPEIEFGDSASGAPKAPHGYRTSARAARPETAPPDLAEAIARVLRDEARRRGIDLTPET